MLALLRLETLLRDLVERLVREGAAIEEVERAVDEAILLSGIAGPGRPLVIEEMMQRAARQAAWLRQSVASPEARTGLASVLKSSAGGFARMEGRVRRDVVDLVTKGLRGDVKGSVITDQLEALLGRERHVAQTVVRTGTAAFDRIGRVESAEKAGVKKYRYAGPSADRRFCQLLLAKSKRGETWTKEEIQAMDNKQGLPVLYHGGGYNCRHDWEPVYE